MKKKHIKFPELEPNKVPSRGTVSGNKIQFAVRVTPDVYEAISEYADNNDRSISNAAHALLREALNGRR